ncbi:MAG: hypothetical protein ABI561_06670 [Bradyrhizobium sp.]
MKYSVISAAVIAIVASVFGQASAKSMSCLGVDMSVMTTMIGTMADGPHKWEMYRNLAAINVAMAGEGTRGCDAVMMDIASGHKYRRSGECSSGLDAFPLVARLSSLDPCQELYERNRS